MSSDLSPVPGPQPSAAPQPSRQADFSTQVATQTSRPQSTAPQTPPGQQSPQRQAPPTSGGGEYIPDIVPPEILSAGRGQQPAAENPAPVSAFAGVTVRGSAIATPASGTDHSAPQSSSAPTITLVDNKTPPPADEQTPGGPGSADPAVAEASRQAHDDAVQVNAGNAVPPRTTQTVDRATAAATQPGGTVSAPDQTYITTFLAALDSAPSGGVDHAVASYLNNGDTASLATLGNAATLASNHDYGDQFGSQGVPEGLRPQFVGTGAKDKPLVNQRLSFGTRIYGHVDPQLQPGEQLARDLLQVSSDPIAHKEDYSWSSGPPAVTHTHAPDPEMVKQLPALMTLGARNQKASQALWAGGIPGIDKKDLERVAQFDWPNDPNGEAFASTLNWIGPALESPDPEVQKQGFAGFAAMNSILGAKKSDATNKSLSEVAENAVRNNPALARVVGDTTLAAVPYLNFGNTGKLGLPLGQNLNSLTVAAPGAAQAPSWLQGYGVSTESLARLMQFSTRGSAEDAIIFAGSMQNRLAQIDSQTAEAFVNNPSDRAALDELGNRYAGLNATFVAALGTSKQGRYQELLDDAKSHLRDFSSIQKKEKFIGAVMGLSGLGGLKSNTVTAASALKTLGSVAYGSGKKGYAAFAESDIDKYVKELETNQQSTQELIDALDRITPSTISEGDPDDTTDGRAGRWVAAIKKQWPDAQFSNPDGTTNLDQENYQAFLRMKDPANWAYYVDRPNRVDNRIQEGVDQSVKSE